MNSSERSRFDLFKFDLISQRRHHLNYELTRQATQHAHHDRSSWCTWPPGTPQLLPMASLAFPLKICLWLKRMTLTIPFRHALPGSFVAIDGAFRFSNIGLVDVRRAGSSLLDLCPSSVCHRCSGSNLCLDQFLCNLPIQTFLCLSS